jgi:hypothetical protein
MGLRWTNKTEDELLKRFAQEPAFAPTSYTATGNTPVPQSVMVETGSERENKFPDIVPALTSRVNAIKIYDQMVANDSTVDVSLRTAKTSINGATFYVEPYSDSQDDQDIAEFVCYNILDGTNEPWAQTLEKVLRMFEYGISIFEPVYYNGFWAPKRTGSNARKYTMLKKLAYRPAATIKEFIYDDNGGPAGVKQNAIRANNQTEEITLDIDNIVVFAFDSNGGPFNGRSLLRKAYKHWYYKDYLYKIDAIQKERHSLGVPHISLEQGFTQVEVDAAWAMVQNLRANEQSGAVTPPGVTFEFAQLHHTAVNVMPSIEHHDVRILLNTLTQFLIMGLIGTGGGGRSTGATGQDTLAKSNRALSDYICAVYNMFVIPKLVGYNFKTTNYPKMQVKRLGETKDLQMWASAWANLSAQGIITPTWQTENFAREELDAPFISEADWLAHQKELAAQNAPAPVATDMPIKDKQQKGDVKTESARNGTGSTKATPGLEATN